MVSIERMMQYLQKERKGSIYITEQEFVFPYSGRQMVKRNFEDLANELLKIGFTEIFTLPLKDLSTGWMKKEYAVQNVLIEGVDAIKKGMILDYDRKITI